MVVHWVANPRMRFRLPFSARIFIGQPYIYYNNGRPMRKREKVEKLCLCCGNFIPNRNVYCNNKCQQTHQQKIIFEKIEKGSLEFYVDTYKNYLVQKYGEKCMKCGWNERHGITGKVPIQLEHIDGNSENNSLDNLILLCPNCHSLTPTFGALNKGFGRKNRYQK